MVFLDPSRYVELDSNHNPEYAAEVVQERYHNKILNATVVHYLELTLIHCC